MEIGLSSASEERSPSLALIYDEMLRSEIENKCGQLGDDFDMHQKLTSPDERVLQWARRCMVFLHVMVSRYAVPFSREWDKTNRWQAAVLPKAEPKKPAPKPEQNHAKRQKIECWKCGVTGHFANQCRSEGKKGDGKAWKSR